jgi:hypothetical protein
MQTDQRLGLQDLGVSRRHLEDYWRVCPETIVGLWAQAAQFSRRVRAFFHEARESREARLFASLEAKP